MESPENLQSSCFCQQFNSDNKNATGGEPFMVDDLLDFSNDDVIFTEGTYDSVTPGNSIERSTITAVDNSTKSSSFSGCEPNIAVNFGCLNFADDQFSSDLVVPYDDLAELEWLSSFVEESFSSEDLQKLQLISGMRALKDDAPEICVFQLEPNRSNTPFNPELSVPAKARSKRSRAPPCSWASSLLVVASTASSSEDELVVLSPQSASTGKKPAEKTGMHRNKESGDSSSGDGRRCLHCATDKTPQWRTGPMGPKTLCNACGVRYKSGRLVPEYRPAASPTFMLTKHSNSHRKVMELRKQKEMLGARSLQHLTHEQLLQQQATMFSIASNDDHEYLVGQHVGPDIGHLI